MNDQQLQPDAPADPADQFVELVIRHLDGRLTEPERLLLNALLAEGPAHRETFVATCTHACLLASGVGIEEGEKSDECGTVGDGSGSPLLGTEVPSPHTADALPSSFILHPSSFTPPLSDVRGWLFSYTVATLVTGLAILGAWTYKVSSSISRGLAVNSGELTVPGDAAPGNDANSRRPPTAGEEQRVGRITGAVDCCCASSGQLSGGAAVRRGDAYQLAAGWLEITYQTGAKVILEGPCVYEVDSAQGGFLSLGKLTARVETKGEGGRGKAEETDNQKSEVRGQESPFPLPPSPFVIKTPTAVVTDLGTEFGVEVGKEGNTTSHVFRGSVRLNVLAAGGPQEIVLRQDESARVEKTDDAGRARLVRCDKTSGISLAFRRRLAELPTQLDLLDIVAGGDGTGQSREAGIDPQSGMQDTWFIPKERWGDGQYRPVPWQKLIDGVFIPDGRRGRVVLDSVGDFFDGFPRTTGGVGCPIWARAAKLPPDERTKDPFSFIYGMGPGKQYMPEGHGLLGFVPNTGMTLDLAAIRESHAGAWPVAFRATAGVADAHATYAWLESGQADIWVFVDGRVKLKRLGLRPEQGPVKLDVQLAPTDRFLTLVAVVPEEQLGCHWLVLGDPVLQMASTDSEDTVSANTDGAAVQLPPQHNDRGQAARKETP